MQNGKKYEKSHQGYLVRLIFETKNVHFSCFLGAHSLSACCTNGARGYLPHPGPKKLGFLRKTALVFEQFFQKNDLNSPGFGLGEPKKPKGFLGSPRPKPGTKKHQKWCFLVIGSPGPNSGPDPPGVHFWTPGGSGPEGRTPLGPPWTPFWGLQTPKWGPRTSKLRSVGQKTIPRVC